MPYMPPFARGEKISDYAQSCRPVEWNHEHIKSLDGTKITLCVGAMPEEETALSSAAWRTRKHVAICYFQGNGSSTPPRLPLLSNVLKSLRRQNAKAKLPVQYTIVALSYRGYWTSKGRASQSGIELDAQAAVRWIRDEYAVPEVDLEIVLWGQSIGAGVATTAAATYLQHNSYQAVPIVGLILETPFTGIKSMLLALYPQRWLPYRYLWPFLWNFWDSEVALRKICASGHRPNVLILSATRDEVVPPGEADKLEQICYESTLPTEREDVMGALHTEATTRREGQEAVASFIAKITK